MMAVIDHCRNLWHGKACQAFQDVKVLEVLELVRE